MDSFVLTFCLPLVFVGFCLLAGGFIAEHRARSVKDETKFGAKALYFFGLVLVDMQLLTFAAMAIIAYQQNAVLLICLFLSGNGCLYIVGRLLGPVYSKQSVVNAFTEMLLFSLAYLSALLSFMTGAWFIVAYGVNKFVGPLWSTELALTVSVFVGALYYRISTRWQKKHAQPLQEASTDSQSNILPNSPL